MRLFILLPAIFALVQGGPYTWDCNPGPENIGGHIIESRCVKKIYDVNSSTPAQGLMACKMTCGKYGVLWPKPSGEVTLSKELVHLLPTDITIKSSGDNAQPVESLINEFKPVFQNYLYQMHPGYKEKSKNPFPHERSESVISVVVRVESNVTRLTLDTDESYTLELQSELTKGRYECIIIAPTYFGARHGLETLSQLITYDENTNSLQMHQSASIKDEPVYPHRGLLIDTSRNYLSLDILRRIIDGLSYNKMNILHWHIIDTASFPLVLDSYPQLAEYGAYSPLKVYKPKDVRELVHYARVRGVKIVPEFDAPAHAGNGWQFATQEHPEWGQLTVCANDPNWQDVAVEPPSGQLNIVNEKLYDVLKSLYSEMVQNFESDLFHFGGDEVNMDCWNSSKEIQDYLTSQKLGGSRDDLVQLWKNFQDRAFQLVKEANPDANNTIKGVIWTNTMTELGIEKFLPSSDYVIQIWTGKKDETIKKVIDKGYQTIFSNYDAWYFDCGNSGWIDNKGYWCQPYHGWQEVYENNPRQIYLNFNDTKETLADNILGGEACLWTEMSGDVAVEAKLWPRASAVGERLWCNPTSGWKDAETRMVNHRERLVKRGLNAEAIQPEWCHQNEHQCYSRLEN